MVVYLYNIGPKWREIGLFNGLRVTVLYLQLSRIRKDLADISEVSSLEETVTSKILSYSNMLF